MGIIGQRRAAKIERLSGKLSYILEVIGRLDLGPIELSSEQEQTLLHDVAGILSYVADHVDVKEAADMFKHISNEFTDFPGNRTPSGEYDRTAKCKICGSPAKYVAAISIDRGETIEWIMICPLHSIGWNDGADWKAPIIELGKESVEI
jgi:hypothetical protein